MPNNLPESMVAVPHDLWDSQMGMLLLRQLVDAQNLNGKKLDAVQLSVNTAEKRLERIENNNLENLVAELTTRVMVLEVAQQQRVGMAKLLELIKSWAPWILALVAGLVIYFKEKPAP